MQHEIDTHGVTTEALDVGAKSTLKAKRRRYRLGAPQALDSLPPQWRELLVRWVKRGARCKWETLLKDAGSHHVEIARALFDWLLRKSWISVIENFEHGQWRPLWLEFPHHSALRRELGLGDPDALSQTWQSQRAYCFDDMALAAAARTLETLPAARALARHALLVALQSWRAEVRYGTRRDFALLARGDTKSLTTAEWDWLESCLDLAVYGIERHTPLFFLRAPLSLETPQGKLDLAAAPDFLALSADTIAAATTLAGEIGTWRLVENRTSFERVAREFGARDGVAWLPGFAPTWWKTAMTRLLRLKPAPALIACDPDPAGIEIALSAVAIWVDEALSWQPWKMDAAELARLACRRPLADADKEKLHALRQKNLPEPLAELVAWMHAHGEKGEQEGFL